MIEPALAYLERDSLRNIVPLKMLRTHPEFCRVQMTSSFDEQGVLIELDAKAFAYDREHYPNADGVILLASDTLDATRALLGGISSQSRWVLKLQSQRDVLEAQRIFRSRRVTAFESFTDISAFQADPAVRVTLEPNQAMLELYAAGSHQRAWLEPLLNAGQAFCCEFEDSRSVCFAFENFAKIWEVGGVYTPETQRGHGFAARVVSACVAELQARGLRARYQVQESNAASIAVARRIGLKHFLTITHCLANH
jgi:RimJ/RimL family protein N-acetyltransferase